MDDREERKRKAKTRLIDSGLFVEWNAALSWVRMKDTNLLYRSLNSAGFDWYILSDDSPLMPLPVTDRRINVWKFFKFDISKVKSRFITLPTSEVVSRLLEVLPPDLQTKVLFNIDLFKDTVV